MAFYRVRTTFSGMQGSPWLSTLHFEATAGTAQQAVTAAGTFWGAVDALIDSEVDWTTEPDVSTFSTAGVLEDVTSTTPVTGTGSSVGDALPLATQALIRLRTGNIVAGRELRGRIFVPALVEASNDNGNVLAASRTTLDTAIATLIGSANADLTIWSRTHTLTAAVQTGSTWTQFAQLRSRRD